MHPILRFQGWWSETREVAGSGPMALPLLLPLHFHAMLPTEACLGVRHREPGRSGCCLLLTLKMCLPSRLGHFQTSLLVQIRLVPCMLLDHLRSLDIRHVLSGELPGPMWNFLRVPLPGSILAQGKNGAAPEAQAAGCTVAAKGRLEAVAKALATTMAGTTTQLLAH